MTNTRRGCAVVVLVVLVACGQKPGVHVGAGHLDGPAASTGTDHTLDGTYEVADPVPSPHGDGRPGAVALRSTSPGTRELTSSPQEGRGGGGGGGGSDDAGDPETPHAAPPSGHGSDVQNPVKDRTGADPDVLRIGAHAPATGAAPIPIDAFEQAMNVYFRWQTEVEGRRIVGRSKVEAIFRDDGYNPSTAIQVCRELVVAQKVFLIFGGGGADQIAACAGYTNQQRVPYLAGGASEVGVRGLPWYFPFSMSYPRQSTLLAGMVAERFPGRKAAMVVTDTPYFEDSAAAFEAAVARLGIAYHGTIRHPKGDTTWYDTVALELARNDVDVVFTLTSGLDYIHLARRAHVQRYQPRFVGVGIGFGFNAIARVACPAGDGALTLSPFPGMDQTHRFDPDFERAVERFDMEREDYAWIVWGASRFLHTMLDRYEQRYGTDLTREDFRDLVENMGEVDSGIFPPMVYSPDDHFGARSVHVLRQSCTPGGGEFVTDTTYYGG